MITGIESQNISDFLRSHCWNFSPEEIMMRWRLFKACQLLIDAERMIASTDIGPNTLNDEITKFLLNVGCYQTWNPPEWIWKEERDYLLD